MAEDLKDVSKIALENRNAINKINTDAKKTSALADATLPLDDADQLRLTQSGVSKKISKVNLNAELGNPFERMRWKNKWVNASYSKNDVVIDGSWTMVANKDTTERAGIVESGSEVYLFDGTLAGVSATGKQLIFGNRYTSLLAGYIKGYRVYARNGQEYVVYSVIDPLGTPIIKQLTEFTATADGWVEVNIAPILVGVGNVIDIVAVTDEVDPTPVSFNGNWNYLKPNNSTIPSSGEIVHSNSDVAELRIHKTDNDSADQSTNLNTLTVGDKITSQGLVWHIQSKTDNTTYYTFEITPAYQASSTGIFNFVFDSVASVPIDYDRDVDYWLGNVNRAGLYILDGTYADITPDDNAYGTDILVQAASIPDDWDILAFSGDAIGSANGDTAPIEIVDNLVTQDSTKALSANQGYVLDNAKYNKAEVWSQAEHLALSAGAPSSGLPVKTDASGKIDLSFIPAGGLPTTTVSFPINIEFTADLVAKGDLHSMHGALVNLATAQPLNSGTPINVLSGISKLLIVLKAGTATGNLTITGTKVDRETGVETAAYVDVRPITTLATDATATDPLGHNLVNITDSIITSVWFKGSVDISVDTANLTDVDVYQVAFEQFNDEPDITINTLDIGFNLNNTAAEANFHLYAVEVGIDGITNFTPIIEPFQLLAADTEPGKYYRLRRGQLNKSLDCTSDGIVLAMNYDPTNQNYFEEVSAKIWASVNKDLTLDSGVLTLTGDGVDNTDAKNPVMDLSNYADKTIDETFDRSLTISNQEVTGTGIRYVLNLIHKVKQLIQIGYDYTKAHIRFEYFGEIRIAGDNNPIHFYPNLSAMLSIDEDAIYTEMTLVQIAAKGNKALVTKEYFDTNLTPISNITWEQLVTLGSGGRAALNRYNITGSIDNTKDYGKVMLLSPDLFQFGNSNNQVETIIII